jgi:DNA-binding HxlR family transcriptional regulator
MAPRLRQNMQTVTPNPFADAGVRAGDEALDGGKCPTVGSLALVTEAKLRVIRDLLGGPKGFNMLMRTTGINSKTLSSTLKFLEQRGIVIRRVVATRPFSVQYSLTASGKELGPVLEEFGRWGAKWLPKSR